MVLYHGMSVDIFVLLSLDFQQSNSVPVREIEMESVSCYCKNFPHVGQRIW